MGPSAIIKTIAGVLFSLVVLSTIFGSWYTISEQERGVLTTWGKYARVVEPGLNFKLPFIQGIRKFPITMQSWDVNDVNTYTIDNQEINAKLSVFFRIPPESIEYVFKNVPDYEARVISLAIDRFKAEMGKINTIQVAQKRGEVREQIQMVIRQVVRDTIKIEVVDFQIPNIDYTQSFRAAVEQSAVAKTQVEKAEQERRRAEIDAQKLKISAEGEANARRETAKGEADAKLSIAKAEAESIRVKGDAEASAIRAQTEALGSNPYLVELRRVERWTGQVPAWVGDSGALPMIQLDPPSIK